MPTLTHDDESMTYACPCCGQGGEVYERTGNGNPTKDPDRPFRCGKCSDTFTVVIERESETNNPGKSIWEQNRNRILESHGLLSD